MKLFKTNNLETVTYRRTQFNFDLPSTVLKDRSDAFARRYKLCNDVFCTVVLNIVYSCLFFMFVFLFYHLMMNKVVYIMY